MFKRMMLAVVALAALLAFAGCAMEPMKPAPDQSLYLHLGGDDAIDALVDDAVGNIAADTRINRRFDSAVIPELKSNLVELTCADTSGPCTYAGRNMSDAHAGMNIRDDEFDALVEDLVKSLDKFKVPDREKGELLAILGRLRNAIVGH
jgi:hemoglobin